MATVADVNAEVIAVYPNKVKIVVDDLENFKKADETLRVGSYLRVMDNENSVLITIIENFSIEVSDQGKRNYIIEANPLGLIKGGEFIRGGDSLAIPPKKVEPATEEEIRKIYSNSSNDEDFTFSSLSTNRNVKIPVNGNKFFNKHIAIVGSTGSGKSHTLTTILQKAVSGKNDEYSSLNNSHIILFDIHSEYKSAFPNANYYDINSLTLPYWLLNSEELEELFLDTDANDHNQRNVFKEAIVQNRKLNLGGSAEEREKIHFDSPVFFDLEEVLQYLKYKNIEKKNKENQIKWKDENGEEFIFCEESQHRLFNEKLSPVGTAAAGVNGKLINFLNRLENKVNDKRYDFLLGENSKVITFEETLKNLLGYNEGSESNITVIDLSGVPFEVLSITVSLISRIIFEYGYFYKRLRFEDSPNETINNDAPILLVYEEAHKYVPNSDLSKYRSSKSSIERIAKEGRKYGVSLLLASQRPSELSETIFSQSNNFIAMRLTNPHDQNYVKKLLPDTLGNLIEKMPSLKAGEALLIGDSVVLPSVVQIDPCEFPPSSNDIPYWDLWREEWKALEITRIKDEWYK
ncbi:anti-phage-associated helicase HerA [Metabacillus litoralis]|uniref:anti-phage-associated helicase HerA n=1 Tax=Metabacillus litoralis TaxID=152268 RepID=UPI00203F3911|nr:anti-phage-associated helicase HerA [Metabacillus litoralis]MCM3160802.1 ATP-binding protein [Metabacillus litoralis]